jgi:phosphonate C-P lyase system protein PhnG
MDEKNKANRTAARGTKPQGPGPLKSRLLNAIDAAEADEAAAALDRIWPLGDFDVSRAPRIGMLMVTACDCFDTPFHLGEVLVSEAEVALDGHHGYGMVCGDAPEKALLAAAVEAAECAGQRLALARIGEVIDLLEEKDAARRRETAKLTAATKVRFASMKKERVDFGSLGEPEPEPETKHD